jgi:uncharacterized protein YgiM (DUF1202 family)
MKRQFRSAAVILALILGGCGDRQQQGTPGSVQNSLQENNRSHSKFLPTKYVHNTVNVRAGAGTHFKIIGKLYKGDKIEIDSLKNNWAIVYKNGERKGYVYANLLKDHPFTSTDTEISDNSNNNYIYHRIGIYWSIGGTDDGYKWNKTVYEAKMNLCEDLARRIGRRDAKFYYDCLEEFYNTSDPNLLKMTIAEIAGMASVM